MCKRLARSNILLTQREICLGAVVVEEDEEDEDEEVLGRILFFVG